MMHFTEGDYMVAFTVHEENVSISARLQIVGPDILIQITGGDCPHIGAVLTLTRETAVRTIKFPSHDGRFHKDDLLAEPIAAMIRPYLTGSCTITAGVHVNRISKRQIEASAEMAKQLGKQIADWLRAHPIAAPKPIYYRGDETPQ
jgi:hypothetical protein